VHLSIAILLHISTFQNGHSSSVRKPNMRSGEKPHLVNDKPEPMGDEEKPHLGTEPEDDADVQSSGADGKQKNPHCQ
jgi:hypothetical protein